MSVVRVGLIGLGGMSNYYRNLISSIDTIQLVAVCDVNQVAVDKVAEEVGIGQDGRFTKIEEIIASLGVDAIISVVPNNVHAKIVELCIAHQKPFMSEKPFTLNMEEAEHLKRLYQDHPIPCVIGFIHRYTPSFQYAKQLVAENVVGRIRHLDVKYQQSFGAPFYQTPYLWRFSKEISGTGALGDLGAHMIDSARFFVGEFQSVSALMKTFIEKRTDSVSGEERVVDVDDYTSFQAVLEHGIVGNFVTTRNAVGSSNQHEVTIYGDNGTINVNIERPNEITLCSKKAGEDPVWETKQVPEEFRGKSLLHDFAAMILKNEVPGMPTFDDGYINQKVIESVIQSAVTGRLVTIGT